MENGPKAGIFFQAPQVEWEGRNSIQRDDVKTGIYVHRGVNGGFHPGRFTGRCS